MFTENMILVRLGGIEPPTFCVSCKRSTTELKTRISNGVNKRSLPAGRQVPLSYARAEINRVGAEGIEPSTSILSG